MLGNKCWSCSIKKTIGDRSSEPFAVLWSRIRSWLCYFWVSDGYCVHPKFIYPEDHIVSKTYMTRVEGENTRLRHYLARLLRKTLRYSKSKEMLQISIRLLHFYLKRKNQKYFPIFPYHYEYLQRQNLRGNSLTRGE